VDVSIKLGRRYRGAIREDRAIKENNGEKRRGKVAEREGFEPSIRFPLYTLSKRAPSTTRPSLRGTLFRIALPYDD
jgi:hypothetical protein